MTRCPRCNAILPPASERDDGFPGVKYESCNACGWVRAVTRKPRREKLPKKNPPLVIFGNPKRLGTKAYRAPVGNITGEIGEVYAIVYRHSESHELMVHGFGPDGEDIELKTLRDGVQITRMNVSVPTGTFAFAVQEGQAGRRTIRMAHVDGEALWDDR